MNFKAVAASLAVSLSVASNCFGTDSDGTDSNANVAESLGKIIPPSQWWHTPIFSPDGSRVAVQTPPPEFIETTLPDKQIVRNQRDLPTDTVVLKTSDFSLVANTKIDLWPTWSPDGKKLCGRMMARIITQMQTGIYDAVSGVKIRIISSVPPCQFAWSPDSNRLFFTLRNNISILDLAKKSEMLLPVKATESSFDLPTWSPDGKLIAATLNIESDGKKKTVARIWDSQTRDVCTQIDLKIAPGEMRWSPNGKMFLFSETGTINVFDTEAKQQLQRIDTIEDRPVKFNWSADGSKFAYKDDNHLQVCDAVTLNKLVTINGPINGLFSFSWSADGNYLLIDAQKTAAICDANSGAYLGYKTYPDASKYSLTPDQKLLIVENSNRPTMCEKLTLPASKNTSPIKDGKCGSPGWEIGVSPKSIEETFALFDRELGSAKKARFKNSTQLSIYGGGSLVTDRMMSDVYGKWNLNSLRKYFLAQDISDKRDVAAILLESYRRHLNKKPIELNEQVADHRAWWANQRPVIESNQKLPAEILDFKITENAGSVKSINALPAKLKIITFVDSDGVVSAQMVKYLKGLRLTYPYKELILIVFVVPPESLTRDKWPAIRTIVMGHGDEPLKAIANFKSNPGEIFIDSAPDELTQALLRIIRPTKYTRLGLPQTLLVTDDMIKIRLNGFEERTATTVLEREIKKALESK